MKLTNSGIQGTRYLVSAAAGLAGLLGCQSASAVSINLVPANQSIALGGSAIVDLIVGGVPPAIGAWDVTLLFNSTLLAWEGVTFGSQLDAGILGSDQSTSPGIASGNGQLSEVSFELPATLAGIQFSSFTLASFQFKGIFDGVAPVQIANVSLSDELGNSIANFGLDPTARITIGSATSVPDQGSSAFGLAIGLGALLAVSGKRRATNLVVGTHHEVDPTHDQP